MLCHVLLDVSFKLRAIDRDEIYTQSKAVNYYAWHSLFDTKSHYIIKSGGIEAEDIKSLTQQTQSRYLDRQKDNVEYHIKGIS